MKPCPFCGNNELKIYESRWCGDDYTPLITIECEKCPCRMQLYGEDMYDALQYSTHASILKTEIILNWNKRICSQ